MAIKLEFDNRFKFDKYFKKFSKEDLESRKKVGLQALNWIVNGSPKESVVPPILTGLLRGSGSIFVGSKYVGTIGGKKGKPNKSHTEKEGVITVGFDTAYAARMHEGVWNPGPVSKQSGDVGNKFIEKHLKADKKEYTKFYAALQKKNVK